MPPTARASEASRRFLQQYETESNGSHQGRRTVPVSLKVHVCARILRGESTVAQEASPLISTATIDRALKQIRTQGYISEPRKPPGRPLKDALAQSFIIDLYARHPTIFRDEASKALKETLDVSVHPRTITKWLNGIGWTKKKATAVAKEQNPSRYEAYSLFIGQFTSEQLCFADETGVDERNGQRTRGYSRAGTPAVVTQPQRRGTRMNVLSGVSLDGVEAPIVLETTVTAQGFYDWVEHHLLPSMNPYPGKKSVLVVDNARIHVNDGLKGLLHDAGECWTKVSPRVYAADASGLSPTGCILVYLPPYTPTLNPIEKVFSSFKRHLQRHGYTSHFDALTKIRQCVTKEDVAAFYRSSGYMAD